MSVRRVFIVSLCLAVAGSVALASNRESGDFVFVDEEGHLVLRFAGVGRDGLNEHQRQEVVNKEFSSMVHDRLRADLLFEGEQHDPAWAAAMVPRLERHVLDAGSTFVAVEAQCRAESCRLFVDHTATMTVAEHMLLLPELQATIEAFIDAEPDSFEPVFMIAAHFQTPEPPFMKVYLRRMTGS